MKNRSIGIKYNIFIDCLTLSPLKPVFKKRALVVKGLNMFNTHNTFSDLKINSSNNQIICTAFKTSSGPVGPVYRECPQTLCGSLVNHQKIIFCVDSNEIYVQSMFQV